MFPGFVLRELLMGGWGNSDYVNDDEDEDDKTSRLASFFLWKCDACGPFHKANDSLVCKQEENFYFRDESRGSGRARDEGEGTVVVYGCKHLDKID